MNNNEYSQYDVLGNYDLGKLKRILSSSTDMSIRTRAITNIGKAGLQGREISLSVVRDALQILAETKYDPSAEIRAYTCAALSNCILATKSVLDSTPESETLRVRAMQMLEGLIEDPSPQVREQARAEYRIYQPRSY